jgi:glycosyltransferase Alg8
MIKRFGRKEGLYSLIAPSVFYFLVALSIGYSMWPYFYYVKDEQLIALGIFALWRYGWQLVNYFRSIIYSRIAYPRLRARTNALLESEKFPDHIFFIIPSYREEPWVSIETFQSILSNLAIIPSRATLIVATASDQEDAVIASVFEAHPVREKVDLVIQRQSQGKRIAMGHALRAVARRYRDEPNSVTIFMDGDSYLEPHTLDKVIPFFSAFGDVGALTTNEVAYINSRSQWYKDWFNLKFGQRHMLFQSHALSKKVLTLTGRFSVFRTSIVTREDFVNIMENDQLTHWMHGKFRFLMGDDKSSWFYLMKHGWNMLYIPDVLCYSLESRDASFFSISLSLPYRWYGNTLRNNGRALALGWKRTGLFIWLAILDQRVSMWTSLVGITGATILSIFKSFVYLPFYIAWVLLVRILQMSIIAYRGHPVSLLTIPLMLYNQWVGSFVKIRAFFNLADQKWTKGGSAQTSDINVARIAHPWARWMPGYMMTLAYLMFVSAVVFAHDILSTPSPQVLLGGNSWMTVDARAYGVKPDDGRDDSLALQQILSWVGDAHPAVVRLPAGELDFHSPVTVTRDNIVIEGASDHGTHLISHIRSKDAGVIQAFGHISRRVAGLATTTAANDNWLELDDVSAIQTGDLLAIKTPNDASFFRAIGSRYWARRYPYLRQMLVEVKGIDGARLDTGYAFGMVFPRETTGVYAVQPVRRFVLRNLSIEQRVPGASPEQVAHRYENMYPDYAVDGVRLEWCSECKVENVRLRQIGRHPINFDGCYRCAVARTDIDGAWNKGKKGNGYLRLARSYHCAVRDTHVRNIRHVAIQWSSAWNTVEGLYSEVDLNFHGGYSHHNTVKNATFRIPPAHPWQVIERTPDDAGWAPPDGPANVVIAN